MIKASDLIAEEPIRVEGEPIRIEGFERDGRRILSINGNEHDVTDIPTCKIVDTPVTEGMLERLNGLKNETQATD